MFQAAQSRGDPEICLGFSFAIGCVMFRGTPQNGEVASFGFSARPPKQWELSKKIKLEGAQNRGRALRQFWFPLPFKGRGHEFDRLKPQVASFGSLVAWGL